MPTQYNMSLPQLLKTDNNEPIVGHQHANSTYPGQEPLIKGCIAFFKTSLENKELGQELRQAAACAVAEDESRIEHIQRVRKEDIERENYNRERNKELDQHPKCVML